MKIKKKTSMLMLLAASLAMVGVVAVSFAAWTGSATTLTADAATGTVTLVGFTDTTSPTFTEKLVPNDQPDGSYESDCAKVISAKLPDFTVYEGYTLTFTVTYTANDPTAKITDENTFELQANYGAKGATTGWQTLNGYVVSGEKPTDGYTVTGQYINLQLVSHYVGTDNPFDGVEFTVTVTLATVPANA